MLRAATATKNLAASDARASSSPGLGYASYVLFVLMVCYTLSFVDRQILSLLVAPIKQDLRISDTQVSLLQGLAFAIFYTALGLPMGRIADTGSRRTLVVWGVVFWSAMTTLCAGARSFWSLFFARMGVGVGEATLAPAAFSLIADYFSKERLGRALSVYSMGIFIGSGLALIVGGSVVDATRRLPSIEVPVFGVIASWRLTFLIVGVPGLIVALWIRTLREPARRNLLLDRQGQPSKLTLGDVLYQIRVRWQSIAGISIGMVFQSMCTYGMSAWMPAFLQRVHGWTPGQAGRTLGWIITCFGCLGMFIGGALTDRWRKQGVREAPLRVAVLSAIGTGALFVPALTTSNVNVTIGLLAPALVCLGLPMGVSYAALQWVLPNQVRGQISALFLLILNLGGLTLGPLLPAVLSDYLFRSEKMIGTALAISIGLASLLMLVTFLSTFRPYRVHSAAIENMSG
jgi:MFS family permease